MNYLNLRATRYSFAPKFMRKEIIITNIEFVDVDGRLLILHLTKGDIAKVNTEWYHIYLVADVNCPRIEPVCDGRRDD